MTKAKFVEWKLAHRRVNNHELPVDKNEKTLFGQYGITGELIDDKLETPTGTYFKVSPTCIERVQTIGSGFNANRYSDIYYISTHPFWK